MTTRTIEAMIAVVLGSVVTAFAYQPSPTIAPPPCFVRLRVNSIHDADTLRADMLLPFGVVLPDRAIRAQGYDAWELSRVRSTVVISDAELAKGKEAQAALQKLISDSLGIYAVESKEAGVYGRVSAYLYVQNKDGTMLSVARWAEDNGHVRK